MVRRASFSYLLVSSLTLTLGLIWPAPALHAQIGAGEKEPVINKNKKKDKKEELPTQIREELPEPPQTLKAEATRLSFVSAPLSGRGLLSQQTRDALKALVLQAHGAQFIRLRAFVAGTGDLRRVPQLVSEMLNEKHLPLPVVTTVQAGALPLENAQVLIEATLQQKNAVNPDGLRFLTAEGATAAAAVAALKQAGELLQATCYVPSLEGRSAAEGVFLVQPQKLSSRAETTCEGVVRASGPGGERGTLVFSGAQMAFGYSEADARLAFERLDRTLKSAGTSLKSVVALNYYPLSRQLGELALKVGQGLQDPSRRPAGLRDVIFEGLPSIDGAFAVEVVAQSGTPN